MAFIDEAKRKAGHLVEKVKRKAAAPDERGESDVASDPNVANSRAGKNGDDGTNVGRTGPDAALDIEESGAEARSEEKRNARK